MPLIVSNTAENLLREYVQNQVTRLSLHPANPTPANEIRAGGYTSPQINQGTWSDTDGGLASNTQSLSAGTLSAAVPLIDHFALRSSGEEVLLSNALTTARSTISAQSILRIAAGALNLRFVTARGSGDAALAISNTLRTGLINTIVNAAATASLHSAQPTDSTRPTNDMEIPTSTGYARAALNPANWSAPALDGVSRNDTVLLFGRELTTAVASATHIALRDSSGTILIENDLSPVLTNVAVGRSITIPPRSFSIRMLA